MSALRIAVFSIGPLFPRLVHGGSQRTLTAIVTHLAGLGHHVSVFCTRRDDNYVPFRLHERATVYPILRFKQTYPESYYSAPYKLAEIIEILAKAVATHDRFYIHDGELTYHFVYDDVPTVVSFQDFVYPDTLAGALSFRRDHLVLSSEYVRACVDHVFSRYRPLPSDMVSVSPNGFDGSELRPVDPTALREELALPPDAIPVLYPHRPDPRKGIHECIRVLLKALDRMPPRDAARVRLLVPVWMDSSISQQSGHVYQGIYTEIQETLADAGRQQLLHLHPWLPTDRMAEYYSLGSATLCIGSFVEAFGNVPVESQLCGTPAIVSRVGAQRVVLPEHLVAKVDYGDEEAAVALLLEAFRGERLYAIGDLRDYVLAKYGHAEMADGYARAIIRASLRSALPALTLPERPAKQFAIPPWCALLSLGYYNDYAYGYSRDERLLRVVGQARNGCIERATVTALSEPGELAAWTADGYLSPGR